MRVQKWVDISLINDYYKSIHIKAHIAYYDYLVYIHIRMVFTETTFSYFKLLQSRVRTALAESCSETPFYYEGDMFFSAYDTLYQIWIKRQAQRRLAEELSIRRSRLKEWEKSFTQHGAIGLLQSLSFIDIDPRLERLIILIKSARLHESSSYALRLANALEISGATLAIIRRTQRSYGYGQTLDENDIRYYKGLQQILSSVAYHKTKKKIYGHDVHRRAETFIDFDHDAFQQKVELFKELSGCERRRKVRPILRQYGIHQNRYYELRRRFMSYGLWGLVDLVQSAKIGEKISPELELQIIEERLMNPSLSAQKMIEKLKLKCCRANVLKVYGRWKLARIKKAVSLRGVLSTAIEKIKEQSSSVIKSSARGQYPELIQEANLKVNSKFKQLLRYLSYRSVPVCNPGAIIIAPFLNQLGIVEALHTYGTSTYRDTEITNNIIVNVLRIIVGFSTINDFTLNTDRSVAIGAGIVVTPKKSKYYESFDELRFHHLQALRNDASVRAKELGIIEGKEVAIDYHCDPSDSRFPHDKVISKSPDKNGDLVYAHRPQILWDSITNSIINIAYCEGRSRAPSALYNFLEENLFKIIDPAAISEIYADSEYTGEKQLVYLIVRSTASVTMCLKQNKKIKKWKEETLNTANWQPYEDKYRLASRDYILAETRKPFRFVIKQNIESNEIRCFGSTNVDISPEKILDSYHLRWPVETGIKDLIENYFLNKPTGTSPEKAETHYYCVMLARLTIDYFLSVFCEPKLKISDDWQCVLSTIRSTLFSNQNCELSIHESGDLLMTYLDGDPLGIKTHLKSMLKKRSDAGLNKVAWWGNRGLRINIEDRFNLENGSHFS